MVETPFSGEASRLERQRRLQKIGVERLSLPEMQSVVTSFGQHLRNGLEGKASSLATIPTLLTPVDLASIPQDKHALVVEIGGSNIYSGIVGVDNDGAQLLNHVMQPLPAKRIYASSNEFFTGVAAGVAPLLHEHIDTAGIIWSFPATIEKHTDGIDAISAMDLPKELVIPDVEKVPVGDQLIRAMREYNQALPIDLPRVVVNDTAAVLLANGGNLGGIVGTGFNFAFSHGGQIYNLEAGGFSEVPQTSLTRQLDSESERPGQYLAEKQVSGKYVEDLFTRGVHELGFDTTEKFQARDVSSILAGNYESLLQKLPSLTPDDIALLQEQAAILVGRSAQIAASMVAGTIQEFPEDFSGESITIPIEGSFFAKTPGYKEAVTHYVEELLPEKSVTFLAVSQSGIKGAGVAALNLLK